MMRLRFIKICIFLLILSISDVQAQQQGKIISNYDFKRVEWLKKTTEGLVSSDKKNYLENDKIFESELKEKGQFEIYEIQFVKSYYYYLKNDYINCIKYSLQASQVEKTTQSKVLIAEIQLHLANSYQRLFYLEKSIQYYLKILDLDTSVVRNINRNRIIMNIGNSYLELKEITKALKYYNQAYNNALIMSDSANIVIGLLNIGSTYKEIKNYQKAEELFKQALALSEIYKIENQTGMCQFNLGELYYLLKNYSQSEIFFNAAFHEFKGGNLDRYSPEINKYFALINFEQKNYNLAIDYSYKFQQEAYKYIIQEKLLKSIKLINQILTKMESNPKARILLNRNFQLLDTVLFKEIEAKRELTESLNKLAVLESVNYKLEKENVNKEHKLSISYLVNIFIICILSIILIALFLFIKATNKIKKQNVLIKKQLHNIQDSNEEARLLLHQKEQQTEEIISQNDRLAEYQNKLEQQIEARTAELSVALLKAQESDNLKTYFLQNISHEIRTPLNAISGFSQLLADDGQRNNEYIEIINQGVSDLLKIVDNIIVYSKLQANQMPAHVKKVSLEKIFQQLNYEAEQIRKKFENKAIKFVSKNDLPDDFCILSDSSIIVKILVQLVENAFKYSEQGSVIASCIKNGQNITFIVKDTGTGIKEDKLQYIFETFSKIEVREHLFRGIGIGLPMVNKLVNLLDGSLTFQSEYGKGTSVSITLPIED